MGYTVFIRDRIEPRYITRHGATSDEQILNLGTPPVRPGTFGQLIWSDTSDLYGADPTRRVELWTDPAGIHSWAEIIPACPGLLDSRRALIRAGGERRLGQLATPYMLHERETWHVQQREAEAWRATPNAAVIPMVTAMAANRGLTIDALVDKIMENVELFRTTSGQILGQQQALLDRIDAATDMDTLLSIAWEP